MRKKHLFVFFVLLIMLLSSGLWALAEAPVDPLKPMGHMELSFATQFSVDDLAGGCSLLSIEGSGRFLIVPEGQTPPTQLDEDITLLQQPIQNMYLAATSAMCLFDALDALDSITLSGTKAEGWYIANARAAMEKGDIVYAGKYSAPDYELILSQNCDLAIESTMITHTPEVKDKLEDFGIPVLMERSSYEPHPFGRTEWIKVYGLLLGKEKLAEELFGIQAAYLAELPDQSTETTVAFFYISSAGNAVARRSGDYVVKMIELAGGRYAFSDLGDAGNITGSLNLEMEQFYAQAKDADVLIYNASIDGEINTMAELLAKSHLLADFKAVQSGNVWCTGKNLFQETTEFGLMIRDMHRIFAGNTGTQDDLYFFNRLQ